MLEALRKRGLDVRRVTARGLCVLATAGTLAGCASGPTSGREQMAAVEEAIAEARVQGCFLGASDPTLDRADARRQAAGAARMRAAQSLLGSRIRSGTEYGTEGHRRVQVVIQETRGYLRGISVLGWWHDRGGNGPHGNCSEACRPDTTWAVACFDGFRRRAPEVLPGAFHADMPPRLRRPGSGNGRFCGIGLSGATLDPDEAREQAVEDARRRLARSFCTEVDDVRVDRGRNEVWEFPEHRATEPARSAVEALEPDVVWRDEEGDGPLHERNATWARVCAPSGLVACR